MFPYFTIRGSKIYMTGIGIVIAFLIFLLVIWYLSKKYLQGFRKFFYWLPMVITLVYFLGSYTQFVLSNQVLLPTTFEHILSIIGPYGYKFHFSGILIGLTISLFIFFRKIKTIENKKTWSNIFFYSFGLCLIPLGIFLLLGDNFIGQTTDSFLGIKSLHSESQLNKFGPVLPIGLFLSIGAFLTVVFIHIKRVILKENGFGMQGFAFLLIVINLILMIQQYPRYMVISIGSINLDIKQHISFFIIMLCFYYHKKRNTPKPILEN